LTGLAGAGNHSAGFRIGAMGITVDKEDRLLNSKEVAQILDLSPDTVNELARKSVLPAFKRGRQWRFHRRDIASFKRELRGTTAA
jgi:excisionase family DNA binding protein